MQENILIVWKKQRLSFSSSAMTLPGSYQSGDGWKPEADDCYKENLQLVISNILAPLFSPAEQNSSSMILVRGLVLLEILLGMRLGHQLRLLSVMAVMLRLRLPVIIE